MDEKSTSFDEATAFFQKFLTLVGVLPNNFVNSRLLQAFFISSSFIHCTMFFGHAIYEDPISLETIYETTATLGIYGRFYILLWRRHAFAELIDNCAELWEQCEAATLRQVIDFENRIRKLFWFIFGSIFACNVLYSSAAIYVNHFAERIDNASKVLPYHWYGVQDTDSWPGYKVVFFIQILVINNAGIVSATVDSALPLVTSLCCGYFRVLCCRFEEMSKYNQAHADRELIVSCKFHQKILSLCSKLEKFGRLIFLLELAFSGYILSLVAVKLASSDPQKLKYAPVIVMLLVHIFICQYAPDLLREESKKVSTAAFFNTSIFTGRSSSRHLLLLIHKSQQPLLMTAGGIIVLSLENFLKMLTSAVSFFTTMRNFS